MSELNKIDRMDLWNEIMRAFTELDKQTEGTSKLEDQAHLAIEVFEQAALIQKEQVWRDISSAPKDGRLMLLELDDGSIKLGRYHKSPTYSFLWWSEDAAPLSEPRRWCPTPPQGEDET